jgi:hypothetical protein
LFKFHIDWSNLLFVKKKQHLRGAGSKNMHKFVADFIGRKSEVALRVKRGVELHNLFLEDEKRLFGAKMQA